MALTNYTSYNMIRAVLGVAETEVEDVDLALALYLNELEFKLNELNDAIITQYDIIRVITENSRTVPQRRFYNLVQTYSAYWIAKVILGGSIEMFAPKVITDAKATQQRVDDPFEALRQAVEASLLTWETRLSAALDGLVPGETITAPVTRRLIGTVTLGVDPVTGV